MSHREASSVPMRLLTQPVLAGGRASLLLGGFSNFGRRASPDHEPYLPLLYTIAAAALVAVFLAVLTIVSVSAQAENPDASAVLTADSAELARSPGRLSGCARRRVGSKRIWLRATIFVKCGYDFVRVATNVKKEDGL